MKYISPFCRIIQVSLDGMLMNSTFSVTTQKFNAPQDESDEWM